MVQVELPSRLGEAGSHQDAIKKPKLTPEQLFNNPDSLGFTEFGRRLCGILIRIDNIKDPNMTRTRIAEVDEEINKGCEEIGIERRYLSLAEQQMFILLKEREVLIVKMFPLDGSSEK